MTALSMTMMKRRTMMVPLPLFPIDASALKSTIGHRHRTCPSCGLRPSQTIDDTDPSHKNLLTAAAPKHAILLDPSKQSHTLGIFVLKVPTMCPTCHQSSETFVCATGIAHFEGVIIMSLQCVSIVDASPTRSTHP
jgi:hypothetical protein